VPNTSFLFVATPAADDPFTSGIEDAHITMCFFGELDDEDLIEDLTEAVSDVAGSFSSFDAEVAGTAVLGPDKASVILIESAELVAVRAAMLGFESVQEAMNKADQFPWWIPHCTTSYESSPPEDPPKSIRISALGFWKAEDKDAHPLSGGTSVASLSVPTIACASDLTRGITYGSQVPSSRWYVMKRAAALGLSDRIPLQWSR
jgi:hypothetical protein